MDIERQSEANLRIQREEEMDSNKKERYIELTGTSKQRWAAIKLVMRIASFVRDDKGKVLKDHATPDAAGGGGGGGGGMGGDMIQIRCDEFGRVIGRGGENIRRIEEESGARLELDRSEGKIEFRGPPGSCARAREMVLMEVTHAKDGDGVVIKDENRMPQDSRRTSGPGGPVGSQAGGPCIKMWVYSKEAGRIIGKGGETVREIMQRTGAEVQVKRSDGSEGPTTERMIQIYGTKQQQEDAFAMIMRDVSYARGEHGMVKSPDMTPREAEESIQRFLGPGAGGGGPMGMMGGPMGMGMGPMGMMPGMGGPMGMMGPMGKGGPMGMMPGMMPGMGPMGPMGPMGGPGPNGMGGMGMNGDGPMGGMMPPMGKGGPMGMMPPGMGPGGPGGPGGMHDDGDGDSDDDGDGGGRKRGGPKAFGRPPMGMISYPAPWKTKLIDVDEL